MRAAEPKDRWKYYVIRFGVIILVLIVLAWLSNIMRWP